MFSKKHLGRDDKVLSSAPYFPLELGWRRRCAGGKKEGRDGAPSRPVLSLTQLRSQATDGMARAGSAGHEASRFCRREEADHAESDELQLQDMSEEEDQVRQSTPIVWELREEPRTLCMEHRLERKLSPTRYQPGGREEHQEKENRDWR